MQKHKSTIKRILAYIGHYKWGVLASLVLAAYYSKGRENEKVEIDYVQKKQVKKVAGAAPGFVIYHTNYSMMATPSNQLEELPS